MASNPKETHATTEHSHDHGHAGQHCCDGSHHHFDPDELFGSAVPEKRPRKVKKPAEKNQVRSETIPGHRGHENIDDLVNFINGPSSSASSSSNANNKSKKK